ncbi:helix-turn-helix transcriptional regulator [Sphingomonas sp. KR3-1]|uniref:helix-turn-helix domain-containing protein n=1 Tax=Sphingomonas sp. KR3-1 TaxID=3156611 RepID=UPI0032B32EC3
MARANGKGKMRTGSAGEPLIDYYRAIVFPNRVREQRQRKGFAKLLRLSAKIPEIPYIRLSKIERGEVVARADELRRVAAALDIAPADLLLDIDSPDFDIAAWAEPFSDGAEVDLTEERFAVLLGAAVRARRTLDPALTIAAIERDYGLPPVNLSRVENAQKHFGRWNAAVQHALLALLGVGDEAELRAEVDRRHAAGQLESFLTGIANPEARQARTRERVTELTAALNEEAPAPTLLAPASAPVSVLPTAGGMGSVRLLPVYGTPLPKGLIAHQPTGEQVEAPHVAGPRAFGLKVCRATLGGGLPAQATVVADPDRPPVPGGLAALREGEDWRLLSVASSRDGRMIGYSVNPDLEIALDDCDPAALAAIISAVFL